MGDLFCSALWREKDIVLGAAVTDDLCATAQRLHGLNDGAGIVLGRLLASTALLRFIQPRQGTMSLQMLTRGDVRQIFADVDDAGNLRGYCRGKVAMPAGVASTLRPALSKVLGPGVLSVLRSQTAEEFTHSAVDLVTSEVDEDVVHFAEHSEQIPTILLCDVHLQAGKVVQAGGVIAQGLPGADLRAFEELRQNLTPAWLRDRRAGTSGPQDWLQHLVPEATPTGTQDLRWQCRCSRERALGALRMLQGDQLRDMISQNETAHVDCDFCGQVYHVAPPELQELLPK